MPSSSRDYPELVNPALRALTGSHAHLAEKHGRVLRYRPDIAPFYGLPDDPRDADWRDAAELAGPGAVVLLAGLPAAHPASWEPVRRLDGLQMVGADVEPLTDAEAVRLGDADVPAMLDLVARTEPGPFRPRTIEMGEYLGIKRLLPRDPGAAADAAADTASDAGSDAATPTLAAMAAMAGERMAPPGHREVSAVCTDPAFRGQGLASRLVRAVATGIRERGEIPFLHVADENPSAIRLYRTLGFRVVRPISFLLLRVPDSR